MSNNAQKTPLARSLNDVASSRALDAIQTLGKALPCHVVEVSGQIVTVAFDLTNIPFTLPNVTMPIATSVYDWQPVQIGDKGYTAPADAYLGGVSGLGGGTADLTPQANLSALVFTPVSSASWAPPGGDPNMRIIQGKSGVRAQDEAGATVLTVTPGNGVFATGTGGAVMGGNLVQAANDAEAAQAGVPINGFYHNNNGVMIRLS